MAPRTLKAVRAVKEVRKAVAAWRKAGESVALVPTMGALHTGHLALVKLARRKADRTVVSLFVNPTQFAPTEDLARYPRDESGDRAKLAAAGADLLWAPAIADMYPEGFATRVEPAGAALGLEGEFRPRHFGGVATVCLKLFTAARPDIAVFGEKDYQQLCVIRQMVRDFDLPLRIVAHPTVREKDGLALSSRNAYLSPDERAIAPALYRTICALAADVRGEPAAKSPLPTGERAVCRDLGDNGAKSQTDRVRGKARLDPVAIENFCREARRNLERAGFTKIDYIEVRDADTLAPFDPASGRPARVLAAAWLGRTRLIDNVAV